MDVLLSRVTQQAVHFAIRSGISITTGYAIKQCGRLLKEAPRGKEREELVQLQARLQSKIRIISPSIDMIELIAARGNTSLDSAVSLTKDIRFEIQKLGVRIAKAANEEELLQRSSRRAKSREETNLELQAIASQIRLLLTQIEDAVPLINLAITTSGVNLSTKLSGSISPSRLLQASTFLSAADSKYSVDPTLRQQVGPAYTLSMYMLFGGHATRSVDKDGMRETTWKEVIHKAHVKLWRIPLNQLYTLPGESSADEMSSTIPADGGAAEFAYQLVIVEDLNDDRVHTFDDNEAHPEPIDNVRNAGIRDLIPIHEVAKIFYADTGKILNLGNDGETNNPVLLLKRDVHAEPPRRMVRYSQSRQGSMVDLATYSELDQQAEVDAQLAKGLVPGTPSKPGKMDAVSWRLPADLDPEWIAFEVYAEDEDSDSDSELPIRSQRPDPARPQSLESSLASTLQHLTLTSSPASSSPLAGKTRSITTDPRTLQISPRAHLGPLVRTSLSLLEMLMKLAALQQFRQDSHLAIEDEMLNFFLEDSAAAASGANKDHRRRQRQEAARRVGFDPYDESPMKRHSNEHNMHRTHDGLSPAFEQYPTTSIHNNLAYDDSYEYDVSLQEPIPRLDFAQRSTERSYSKTSSSPSSSPMQFQQTPSRTSTPDLFGKTNGKSSKGKPENMRSASPPHSRPTTNLPITAKTRQSSVRAQSEPIGRSPLGHEVKHDEHHMA